MWRVGLGGVHGQEGVPEMLPRPVDRRKWWEGELSQVLAGIKVVSGGAEGPGLCPLLSREPGSCPPC